MDEPTNETLAVFKAIVWKLSVLAEYQKISNEQMQDQWDRLRQQQSLSNDETKDILNEINEQLTKLIRSREHD